MGNEVREVWGINGNGFIVSRLGVGVYDCDPDELSYVDRIRRRYLRRKQKRLKKGEPEVNDWDNEEWFSELETNRFLGYPELPFTHKTIKTKYSFEEKFAREYLPTTRLFLSPFFPAVVSLTSFLTRGNKSRLFTCSGIVIATSSDFAVIVTSACLVCRARPDGKLKAVKHLKIKVRFGYDEPCHGALIHCCLNYNLAFIAVKNRGQTSPVPMGGGRSCLIDDVQVFAIGEHYLTGDIMVASGRTISKENPFDCEELMFSTCKITKCGIGGPLVDSTGCLIGINFYDENDTPYIPTCLILKCWYHLRSRGTVMQPYIGWKLRVIGFQHIYKIYVKHQLIDAVAVDKVKIGSPAQLSGICDGDIIVEFCGEPATFLAECAAVLLDKKLHNRPERDLAFEVKIVRGEVLKSVRMYTRETLDTRDHDVNRWPLPKLEWEVIAPPRDMYCREYPRNGIIYAYN